VYGSIDINIVFKKENHAKPVNLNLGFSRVSVHMHNVVSITIILKSWSFDCFQTKENR